MRSRADLVVALGMLGAVAAMESTHVIRGRDLPSSSPALPKERQKPRRMTPDAARQEAAQAKRAAKAAKRARAAARHEAAQRREVG